MAAKDRPSLDYTGPYRFAGFRTTTFDLKPNGGTYDIGDGFYTLTVPANGVCVLGSSYGPDQWDAPCETLANGTKIRVTATFGFANGGPVVDFSPSLRFNPNAQVTLSTAMYAPILSGLRGTLSSNSSLLRNFAMYYTPDLGSTNTADAEYDSTVVTHINLRTGVVWRRVKHFSGYNLTSGRACDPSPDDPNCVDGPAPVVDGR